MKFWVSSSTHIPAMVILKDVNLFSVSRETVLTRWAPTSFKWNSKTPY